MQPNKRGRPRNTSSREKILKAAFGLASENGLQSVSVEAIAQNARVAKSTIYRWWPNKSAVIMEAFLERVAPNIRYEESNNPLEDILGQMQRLAAIYSQAPGKMYLHLVAQAQFDEELACELAKYVRERRVAARQALHRAVSENLIAADVDLEIALDQLYAPIFYRLLAGYAGINKQFVEDVFNQVLSGIKSKDCLV